MSGARAGQTALGPKAAGRSRPSRQSNVMSFSKGPKKPREPLTEAALFEYATASLGRRAQTVAELKRKLRTRVEADEAGERKIATVVARLKEYKFLNDASFAADYTRLRQENDKLGRRRV